MRITYIIIGILVVCGIAASVFLIPTKEEVAMMKVDGSGLIESQASYETQITVGNLSPEVVFPLVRIYLEKNELDRAIKLLESYLEKFPDDIRALDRVAQLYQYAGRQEDYAAVLERLNQLKDDPANLEKLSDIYNYRQEYEKQAEVLQKLIDTQPDYAQNYIRLGYVYRQMERYSDAAALMKRLSDQKPGAINEDAMEIWAGSLVMMGQADQGYALATDWLAKRDGREQRLAAARFANVFYASGRADLSLKLLEPHLASAPDEPEITAALVRAELATGKEQQAFDRMMGLYKNRTLPDSLRELFLEVSIKNRNVEMVSTLASNGDAAKLTEPRLIQIVQFFLEEQKFDLIEKLRTDIGAEKMGKLPVLDAIIALGLGEGDAKTKVEALAERKDLQVYQALALSQACADAEFMELSKTFLTSLAPYTQVKDPDLAALSGLFLANGMEDEGFKVFEEFRKLRPSLFVDIGWVKLAAAKGQEKEVIQWLNSRNDDVINPALTKDLYYIANDFGHQGIALVASKRLYWRVPTDDNQFLFASALVHNGKPVEAMEHLKELKDAGFELGSLYLSTLYAAAREDARYRGELLEYLEAELNQPQTPTERKLAILQLMVEYGIADKYEAMMRENALTGNTQWYYLYTAQLRKTGRKAEIVKFDREMAFRPGAPVALKRRYAYDALARGNKEDALKLFAQLAEKAGPDSKDVRQLVYLWGPRPEEPQLNWLAHRAVNAPPSEREAWIDLLYNAGGYQQMVAIVEKIPNEKRTAMMRDHYLNALLLLGYQDRIGQEIMAAVASTNDPQMLENLGDFGMANGFESAAEQAYLKLEPQEPQNKKLLLNMGFIRFGHAEYTSAYQYFERYNRAGGTDYRAYYYAGESLYKTARGKARDTAGAPFFAKALEQVKYAEQDKNARLITAQSLFRLKRYQEAKAVMAGLVRDYPRETVMKADYMLMLVTDRQYDEARRFVHEGLNVQAAPESAKTTTLPGKGLVAVRSTQVPNELVLVYDKSIAKHPAIQALNTTAPKWLSLGTVGYESAVVTTAYGSRLQTDFADKRGGDGNFTVALIPLKPAVSPAQEREAHMRIELLRAQVELETGNQDLARMYLEKTNEEYPNQPDVLTALSGTEFYMGRELKAYDHIEQAHQIAPRNEEVQALRARINEDRRDFAKLDAQIELQDDDLEYIVTLSGEKRINRENVVGVVLAQNYVDAEGIRRADGRFGDFSAWRFTQQAYLRHQLENGDEVKVSAFYNEDEPGGAIEYLLRYYKGDVRLFGEYHRPNWDFPEGVLDSATRDRIGFTQTFRVRTDIAPQLTVAYNRYHVEDHSNVDESVTVTGIARLPLYYVDRGLDHRLFAEYGLDAEYRLDEERGTDAAGNSYLYYPLVTREVHYATIGWRQELETQYILPSYWEAYAGYAVDRLGGNGPYLGGRWVQQVDADKEAELRASHSISFRDTGADSTRVGGYLNWKF